MKLIPGKDLTPEQRSEVLAAFGYRWTKENRKRAEEWLHGVTPTTKPVSDKKWLESRSFHFANSGKLSVNHDCELIA